MDNCHEIAGKLGSLRIEIDGLWEKKVGMFGVVVNNSYFCGKL